MTKQRRFTKEFEDEAVRLVGHDRDKRAGRAVTVKIVPQFGGGSVRPSVINVWWTVDGKEKSVRFPDERSEKCRGGN